MHHRSSVLLGRHLLDRRGFLAHMATGMGGIALSATAGGSGLARGRGRDARPGTATTTPGQSARAQAAALPGQGQAGPAHLLHRRGQPSRHLGLQARADRSGNGQPMPGVEKLITFQGENGNLAQSPWKFRPRGQSGQVHLRPACRTWPSMRDDLCFIHSLTSKTNTHGPGEMFMSTGFTLEGFPSIGRVGQLRAGDREPGPARLRGDPRPARRPAARAGELGQRLPAGRLPGDGLQRRAADQPPRAAAGDRARRRPGRARLPPPAQRRTPEAQSRRHRAVRPGSPPTSWPAGCSSSAPRSATCRARARRPGRSTASTTPTRSRPRSAATACSPAGCWSAGCGSSRSSTAPSPWARASSTGTATGASSPTTTATARSSTSPPRRS